MIGFNQCNCSYDCRFLALNTHECAIRQLFMKLASKQRFNPAYLAPKEARPRIRHRYGMIKPLMVVR